MNQQSSASPDATALLLFTGGKLNEDSQRPLWIYKDYQGSLQGPFSAANMLQWYATKRLPDSLHMCGITQQTALSVPLTAVPANCFQPLGSLMASTAAGAHYVPLSITQSPGQLPINSGQTSTTSISSQATMVPIANTITSAQPLVPVPAPATFNIASRSGQALVANNSSAAGGISAAPLQVAPQVVQAGALMQNQPQQVLLTAQQQQQLQAKQPNMVVLPPQQQQPGQRQLLQVLGSQPQQPGAVMSRVALPQPAGLQPMPGRQLVVDASSGQQPQVPTSRAVLLSAAGVQQAQQGARLAGPQPVQSPGLAAVVSQQLQLVPGTGQQPTRALQMQLPSSASSQSGIPTLVTADLASRQQVAQPPLLQRASIELAPVPVSIQPRPSIGAELPQHRLQATAGPHSVAMVGGHLALGQQPTTSTAMSLKDLVQLALPGQHSQGPASGTTTGSGPASVGRSGQVPGLLAVARSSGTEVSQLVVSSRTAAGGIFGSGSSTPQQSKRHNLPAGSSFDSLQQLAQQASASAAGGGVRASPGIVNGNQDSKVPGGAAVNLTGDRIFSSTSSLLSMAHGADQLLKVPEPARASADADSEDVDVVIDDLLDSLVQDVATAAVDGIDEPACQATASSLTSPPAGNAAEGVAASEGAGAAVRSSVAATVVCSAGPETCAITDVREAKFPGVLQQQRVVQGIAGQDPLLARAAGGALPVLSLKTTLQPRQLMVAGGTGGPGIETTGQNPQQHQRPQLSIQQQVLMVQQQQQERLMAQAQQQQRNQSLLAQAQRYSDQQQQLLLAQQLLQQQRLREQVAQLHSRQHIEQRVAQQQSAQQQQLPLHQAQQQTQGSLAGLSNATELLHNEASAQQQQKPPAALSVASAPTPQSTVKLEEPGNAVHAKQGLVHVAGTALGNTDSDGAGTKLFDPFGTSFIDPLVITEPTSQAKPSSPASNQPQGELSQPLQEQQPGASKTGKQLTEEQEREIMAALMPELAAMGMTTEQQLAVLKQMLGYREQQMQQHSQQDVASEPKQSDMPQSAQSAGQPQHVWLQQLAVGKSAAPPAADAVVSQVASQPSTSSVQVAGVTEVLTVSHPPAGGAAVSDGEEEFDPAMLPSDLFDFLDAHNSPTKGSSNTNDLQFRVPTPQSINHDHLTTQDHHTSLEKFAAHAEFAVSKVTKYVPPGLRSGPGTQQSSSSSGAQSHACVQHPHPYSQQSATRAASPPPPGFEAYNSVGSTAGAASAAQSATDRDWSAGAQQHPPQHSNGPRACEDSKPQVLDGRSNIIRLFEQARAAVGAARGPAQPPAKCEGPGGSSSAAGIHHHDQQIHDHQHGQPAHEVPSIGQNAGAGGARLNDEPYRSSSHGGSQQHAAAPGAVRKYRPAEEDDSWGDEWFGSGHNSNRDRKGWDDPRVSNRNAAKGSEWQGHFMDEECDDDGGYMQQASYRSRGRSHAPRHQPPPAAAKGRGRGYYNEGQWYEGASYGYSDKQKGSSRPTRHARETYEEDAEDGSLTWQQQQLLTESAAAPMPKGKAVPVVEYAEAEDNRAVGRRGHEHSRSGWVEQYNSRQRPLADSRRGPEPAPTPQPSQHLRQAAHSNRQKQTGSADSAPAVQVGDPHHKAAVQHGRSSQADSGRQVNAGRGNRQQQQPGHHASNVQKCEITIPEGQDESASDKPSEQLVSPAAAAALAAVQGLKPYCTLPPSRKGSGSRGSSGGNESPHSLGSQLPSIEETKAAVLAALGPLPARTSPTVFESQPPVNQQGIASPGLGPAESKEVSTAVSSGGALDASSSAPPKRTAGSGSLFSSVIGQLRKQATGGTGRGEDCEYAEVSTSTVPDTYPSTSHNIVRSQPASQTVPLAPDITPPAPSAHLSAASSRRAAGGAADIVLAAIQTTRQRSHGNTRPKGGRGRQGSERGPGKAGKADAAWREADTASAWDSGFGP